VQFLSQPSDPEAQMTKWKRLVAAAGAGAAALAGCTTPAEMMASDQAAATQVALRRGQHELACPDAKATIVSSNLLQAAQWHGQERTEFNIAVDGCSKRATYVVICQVNPASCFAGKALF
jgi:hypothetical protein